MDKKTQITKNLTIRDIHVGDWVQCWSEKECRYISPVEVVAVQIDGTVHVRMGNISIITNVSNVDELPVTLDLVKKFGFEYDSERGAWFSKDGELVYYHIDDKLFFRQYPFFGNCMSDIQEQMYNEGYDPKFELV